jgi:hypothetical protein
MHIHIGPILAIVSIVLPFGFWHAWQAHPSLGKPPSPTRREFATPPRWGVECIEKERWPIPRAFRERFSSVARAFLRAFLAVFGHVSSDFSAAVLHSALPSPLFVVHMVLVR